MSEEKPWAFERTVLSRASQQAHYYYLVRYEVNDRFPKSGAWRLRPFEAPEAPPGRFLVFFTIDSTAGTKVPAIGTNSSFVVELSFPDPVNTPQDKLTLPEIDALLARELGKEAPKKEPDPIADKLKEGRVDYHLRVLAAKANDLEQNSVRSAVVTKDVAEYAVNARGLRGDLRSLEDGAARATLRLYEVMEQASVSMTKMQQNHIRQAEMVAEALEKWKTPPPPPPPINVESILNTAISAARDIAVTLVRRKEPEDRAATGIVEKKAKQLTEGSGTDSKGLPPQTAADKPAAEKAAVTAPEPPSPPAQKQAGEPGQERQSPAPDTARGGAPQLQSTVPLHDLPSSPQPGQQPPTETQRGAQGSPVLGTEAQDLLVNSLAGKLLSDLGAVKGQRPPDPGAVHVEPVPDLAEVFVRPSPIDAAAAQKMISGSDVIAQLVGLMFFNPALARAIRQSIKGK